LIAIGADDVVKFETDQTGPRRSAEVTENLVGDGVNQTF
jgi:hypothetical protein